MMTKTPELDDLLARIQRKERRSQLAIVLYTLVPTALVCAIIIFVMAQIHNADVALTKEKVEAKDRIKDARIEEERKRSTEFQIQVKALIDGPVQAYVRPGKFFGDLVTKKTFGEALQVWNAFHDSPKATIRTKEIKQVLDDIKAIVAPEPKQDPDNELTLDQLERIKKLVIQLNGTACKNAWKHDSNKLSAETKRVFHRTLYDRAVGAANAIAKPETDTADNRQEFLGLYWGELPLIEDSSFAGAMMRFRSEMLKAEPNRSQLQSLANDIATQRDDALAKLGTETRLD